MSAILEKIAHAWWGPLLVLAAPFFIILAPLLVGGNAIAESDAIQYHYGVLNFIKHSLGTGQALLWSGQVFSGFPTFVLGVFFHPFFLLLNWWSVFAVYNWLIFLNLLAASLLMYAFIRRLVVSFWPAVLGGLIYPFTLWGWSANIALVGAMPILPLIFIVLHSLNQKINIFKLLGLAAVIAYTIYVVNFNLLPLMLVAGFFYALFLGYQHRSQTHWLRLPLLFGASVIGGLAVGWPQLSATLKFSALSARSGGLSFAAASEGAITGLDFIKLLLPYTKLPIGLSENYLYVGALPLLLLLLFRPKQSEGKFFLAVFLVGLGIAVRYSPLFWLMSKLPLLNTLRAPGRWLFVSFFAAAVLSALSLERITNSGREVISQGFVKIYGRITVILLIALTTASLILGAFKYKILSYVQDYFRQRIYATTSQLPLEHYYTVLTNAYLTVQRSLSVVNPRVALPLIFLILCYFLLRSFKRQVLTSQAFTVTAVVMTAANFMLGLLPYHPRIQQELLLEKSDFAQLIEAKPGKYFTFMPGFSEYHKLAVPHAPSIADSIAFERALLVPNTNLYDNLSSADFYHNLQSRRMVRLLALIGSDRATMGDKLTDEKIPIEEKVKKLEERKHILNLLGINYIISAYPLDENKFVKIAQSSATRFAIPIYLYTNPEARPVVYLADETRLIAESEDESFRQVTTRGLGGRAIVLECERCLTTAGKASGSVTVQTRQNGKWNIQIATPDDRWLVISENYLPGWSARLDGTETEINFANSTFMAIIVPAGRHEVSLEYKFRKSF